jgi:hypothetical protein
VGTGYSLHIAHSRSVKARRHRISHQPVFREYVVSGATTELEPC